MTQHSTFHLPTRARAVRVGLALAVAAGLTSGAGVVRADDPPPLVHIEGSKAECVTVYIGQGLTLAQTAALCDVQLGIVGSIKDAGGVDGVLGAFPGFQNAESGPVNVSCPSGASADPRLADTPEKKKADDAEKKLNDFDTAARENPPADDAARREQASKRGELVDAVNAARAALEATRTDRELREKQAKETQEMLNNLSRNPLKGKGNPGGSTVDNVTSACQQFASFVGECNLAGWATSPCQMLRNQMEGCADQTIAYTTGEPGDGCARLDVDAGEAAAIIQLHCSKIGKVMPGMDPCAPPDTSGGPGMYRLPNGDVCSVNPWAASGDTSRTTGEGCEKEFTSMLPSTFGNPNDLSAMIVVLGGPGSPTGTGGPGVVSPPPGCKTCWG